MVRQLSHGVAALCRLSLPGAASAPYHAGMRPTHTLLALVLSAACFAVFAAEEPPPFTAATADGTPVRGPLRELKPDWSLRLGDKSLTAKDLVSVRRTDAKLPPLPSEAHVLLANGDRVPIKSPRLAGEKLHFLHPDLGDGKEVGVPLSGVSVLWLAPPDNVEHPDQLRRRLAAGSRAKDRVLLRNGDAVEGLFTALDARRLTVEVDKKPVAVEFDKVAAVALSTDDVTPLKPKGVYGRVTLADGTRLSLASAECDGTTLRGTTAFGSAFRAPLARVVSLDLMQGAAAYLSDLKPAKFEHTPYLGEGGVKWPLAVDSAVTGRDLRLGGSTYDKGLGMHSRSRVTYALDGKYRRFEAVVGLDDATGRDGAVRVRVLGDGKPLDLGRDGELTAKGGPLAVGVKIDGAKELTLEVDFGRRGDVQGHVDWCDARVTR